MPNAQHAEQRRAKPLEVESVDFASLYRRFEHEYGDTYARLAAQLSESYPEITRQGRRTGRALRNICFFVWCCCRDGDPNLIPTMFRAAVLLSAQDDYYDNPRIPDSRKESFSMVTNHALRTSSFRRIGDRGLQLRDLVALWTYVAETIPRSDPEVRSYWIATACQLNTVMAAENRAIRSTTITYEEYMGMATYTGGTVFMWATYLAHEQVPMATVLEMAPVLVKGAEVVRLSNDLASYRQHRDRENAVTLLGGSRPEARILRLVEQKAQVFHNSVESVDVGAHVRRFLRYSVDFVREFYQRSDFGRRTAW